MNVWLKLSAGMAALAVLAALPVKGFAADAAHPTVVELFQSQGCSSCPPAAANLLAISDRPDVLALSFAVDYWDRLGWKDTFSKHAWTERQYAYSRAMGGDGVYTPQVVVNGKVAGVGAEASDLANLVSRGDRGAGGPAVSIGSGAVTVGAAKVPSGNADVWLAFYDPHTVDVAVQRGENAGRTLPHKDVVRDLVHLGQWRGEAQSFSLPEPRAGLSGAILVQASGAGPILAAARW